MARDFRRLLRPLGAMSLLIASVIAAPARAEDPSDSVFGQDQARVLVAQARGLSAPARPASVGASDRLGSADWGLDPDTGQAWTASALARRAAAGAAGGPVGQATARVIAVAQQTLGESISAPAELHMQGVVFSDPLYRQSQAAVKTIPDIYDWAMCARVGGPGVAAACSSKAAAAALSWAAAYRPTGDPINEGALVPLLLAIDLLAPVVPADQKDRLLAWASSLAAQGDALYASWPPSDGRQINNWCSWRLLIRGVAAEASGDEALKASTRGLISSQVDRNIRDDGSSVDFHTRDALHYHVYDLMPLVELTLFAPDLVDAQSRAKISKGLQFLRPYYTGQERHVEFVQTTVPFDITRKQAGDPSFQNAPWNPSGARPLLRLAREAYPEVDSWTGDVVDPNYSPMIKQIAALHDQNPR